MAYLTNKDFFSLVSKKGYVSEKAFELDVINKLPSLLNVKPSQVKNQILTTEFDNTLSNCADVVIQTEEDPWLPLIVIELKLDRYIKRYHGENYTDAEKQLRKYCQDIRAIYGVLLTDNFCLMYRFNYSKPQGEKERVDRIPFPDIIEKEISKRLAINAILNFRIYKYLVSFILAIAIVAYLYGLSFAIQTKYISTSKTTPVVKTVQSNPPKNIITPISNNRVTISFDTKSPSYASVLLFRQNQNQFSEVGDTVPLTTQHHAVFTDLIPSTNYFFKIIIDNEVFDNQGQFYRFTTGNN